MDFLPFTRPDIDEPTIAGVGEVLRSGWITSGPQVKAFEAALSKLCGGRPVRCFNSGTATLEIGLRLAGIGEGDEVITSPLSWVATANVVLEVRGRPVFVDVDPRTRNIDLDAVEKAVTPATRAIIPVDLAGLPVDRDRLYDLARRKHLRVIEDAAQSFGANWHGKPLGSFGDLVSFSFHANKNITSAEGGALVLPDERLVPLCEALRLQGVVRSGEDGMESNWHMFQVVLPERMERAKFIARMRDHGIGVGVHYPAMHLFKLYRRLGWHEGQFPHAERIGRQIATLPLFPRMADSDVDRVCEAARKVLS